MQYVTNLQNFILAGESAVTIGKFDGFHLGHRRLMEAVTAKKSAGLTAVLFTVSFPSGKPAASGAPGGKTTAASGESGVLMTDAERRRFAEAAGMDVCIASPFVPAFFSLSPQTFLEKVLLGQLHMRYMAVGEDFRFGFKAQGDAAFLRQASARCGFELEIIPTRMRQGRKISSTYAREQVLAGNFREVKADLGYAYTLNGTLFPDKAGREDVCFHPDEAEKLLPPDGTYPVLLMAENERFPALFCRKDAALTVKNLPKKIPTPLACGVRFLA